ARRRFCQGEARVGVGGKHRADEVAEMLYTVDVRQRGGDEIAAHTVPLVLSVAFGKFRGINFPSLQPPPKGRGSPFSRWEKVRMRVPVRIRLREDDLAKETRAVILTPSRSGAPCSLFPARP